MAVLIDMEMPEGCEKCREGLVDIYADQIYCALNPSMRWYFEKTPESRPDGCLMKEVITCEECKHWYSDADTGMACEFTNMSQPEDGFCNWGERKTDG